MDRSGLGLGLPHHRVRMCSEVELTMHCDATITAAGPWAHGDMEQPLPSLPPVTLHRCSTFMACFTSTPSSDTSTRQVSKCPMRAAR